MFLPWGQTATTCPATIVDPYIKNNFNVLFWDGHAKAGHARQFSDANYIP